jgi:protoheme IX farnesyltransferase
VSGATSGFGVDDSDEALARPRAHKPRPGRMCTGIALLQAAHLAPTIAVTSIAAALAAATRGSHAIVPVGVAVASGQLAVGWSNDYIDRHRDLRAARLDKPIVASRVSADLVRRAATIAAVLCVPLSLLSGWRAAGVHIGAVGAALMYNTRLKQTIASPLPYAIAFAALPAFVTLGLPEHPMPPWWAMAASGSLGCGAHFVNTLDDIDDDRREDVLGLPQRLGVGVSLGVGTALVAAATCILTFAPAGSPGRFVLVLFVLALALVASVIAAAVTDRVRLAWPLTIASALIATALLLASGASLA